MTEDSETSATAAEEMSTGAPDESTETAPASNDNALSEATVDAEISEPPTLRKFFGLPENAAADGDDRWKAFEEKLAEEAKGIKWTAAMPDLGPKICELLDIRIHDVLLTAWKKVEAVRQALEESKQTPDKTVYLDLTEHNIDYETKPFIDVKLKSVSVKKLTLHVAVALKVKGFGLKIQNGAIRELQTGKCEGKGAIKYAKLSIAEKKLEPIKFPLSIRIPSLISIPEDEPETPANKTAGEESRSEKTSDAKVSEGEVSKTEEQIERIEL